MDKDAFRSRLAGCFVCRSRKVKCDRAPLACHNCERLGVHCPGYSQVDLALSVESVYEASGVEKRRIGACQACRRQKSKCSKTRPSCHRCLKKELACVYALDAAADLQSQQTASCSPRPSAEPSSVPLSQTLQPGLPDSPFDRDTEWMYDDTPPTDRSRLRLLVGIYFERIYPLRGLGFIHKPSFIQALDQGTLLREYGTPLVYVIAALGLRTYYQDNLGQFVQFTNASRTAPGSVWVEKARTMALADIDKPTMSTLATLLLVCEYAIRTDQQVSLFILVACCYRMVLLLRLNNAARYVDATGHTTFTQLESELRMVWACYILDSTTGSGVDSQLSWRDKPPEVPLPSSEANYMSQIRIPSCYLTTLDALQSGENPDMQFDLAANTIRLFQLRTQVLRLIRQKRTDIDIWKTGSSFLHLLQQLEDWYRRLPEQLLPTAANIYVQKELHTLGAVFGLHFAYHTVVTDLTRISLPGYHFPLASALQAAPVIFRRQCQQRCRFHADEITRLVRFGFQAGLQAFDDLYCMVAAFESTKIQIVHTATATSNGPIERQAAEDNIRSNLELLATSLSSTAKPQLHLRTLLPLLSRFAFHALAAEWAKTASSLPPLDTEDAELTGPADVEYQSSLSSFRLAVSEVSKRPTARALPAEPPSAPEPNGLMVQPPAVMGLSEAGQAAPATPWPDSNAYWEVDQARVLPVVANATMEQHIRLAEEMSRYITWDMGEL